MGRCKEGIKGGKTESRGDKRGSQGEKVIGGVGVEEQNSWWEVRSQGDM